jgi:hypothetical protein
MASTLIAGRVVIDVRMAAGLPAVEHGRVRGMTGRPVVARWCRCGGIVSVVGHLGVPVQEGCLDSQYVLVVKPAGVDVVVSAAATV